MNKISVLLLLLLVGALVTAGIFFTKNKDLQKQKIKSQLQISFLQNELSDLQSKVSDLEDEKEELEDKLSKVEHFDDDNFTSSSTGVTYTGDALRTHIDGDFNGWEGETIFQMTDGSIWKQASYDYTYHYAYSPAVLIYRKGGGYYMHVEDVDEEIMVERIR